VSGGDASDGTFGEGAGGFEEPARPLVGDAGADAADAADADAAGDAGGDAAADDAGARAAAADDDGCDAASGDTAADAADARAATNDAVEALRVVAGGDSSFPSSRSRTSSSFGLSVFASGGRASGGRASGGRASIFAGGLAAESGALTAGFASVLREPDDTAGASGVRWLADGTGAGPFA
jgi:hypothetical protein